MEQEQEHTQTEELIVANTESPVPAGASAPDTSLRSQQPRRYFQEKHLILAALIFLVAVLGGLGYFGYVQLTQLFGGKQGIGKDAEPANAVFNLNGAEFAQYKEVRSNIQPSIQPYVLHIADISNLASVSAAEKLTFSQSQLQALEQKGFFIQPGQPPASRDPATVLDRPISRSDDMVDQYVKIGGSTSEAYREPENAVFVTTDFLIHVFHVLVDRSFQKIEETDFQPTLKRLTQALSADALSRYTAETDPKLKESWKQLTVFYLVPQVILEVGQNKPKEYFQNETQQSDFLAKDQDADSQDSVEKRLLTYKNSVPADIYSLAEQEIRNVMKADGFGVPSPLYGTLKPDSPEDYTQYSPRSHYTRNSVLRTYFRAMMWYGRHGFDVKSIDLTRDAALMTWQLSSVTVDGSHAAKAWETIYLPTVFFVGRSDDLTIYEYSDLMKKVYGDTPTDAAFADATKLLQFQEKAKSLEGPKILSDIKTFSMDQAPTKNELLSDTKGFRFMGQRFIPDSYMFSSLTQGDEQPDKETGQKLPSMPTALMIMSILGSKPADMHLSEWISTNAPQSDAVIAKVKKQLSAEFAKYDEKTWTQNIYWAWLYNLKPLFADYTDGYPMFMRNSAWPEKSLATALGSWTELRHDTLLYAKQSFSEMGGGGEEPVPPPVPKGYVEPNLSFLTRLIALTTMTRDGLASHDLLVGDMKEKFENYLTTLQFFKTIAEKELGNSAISDEEYEKLRTIIQMQYPYIVWTPDGDNMTEQDARTGIIADVHTDAKTGRILYEATGIPSVIYVAVKDNGGTRLTRGVTYSYYEFAYPVGTRLSDQDWQGMLYDGKTAKLTKPAVPSWENSLVK